MKVKIYHYPYRIQRRDNSQYELISEDKSNKFEQFMLFNAMLNFGYISFSENTFQLTDNQIVDFFYYARSSVLHDKSIEEYYSLLKLPVPYTKQIPTITEREVFVSDSYQMNVSWINDISSGKMASAPKSYKNDGLELFNFEGEPLGSLFPEYYELYELIDTANENWKNWTKTERYAFLDRLMELSQKRKVIIPKSLLQAYAHIN